MAASDELDKFFNSFETLPGLIRSLALSVSQAQTELDRNYVESLAQFTDKWGIHLLGPHSTCCGRTSNSLPRAAGTAPDRLVRRSEAGGRTAVHAPVNAGD